MQKNIIEILEDSLEHRDHLDVSYEGAELDSTDKRYFDLSTTTIGACLLIHIKTAIEYIGHEVIHQDNRVKLSWQHIDTYLNAFVPEGYDLPGIMDFVFRSLISKIDSVKDKGIAEIVFLGAREQIALAYVDYLRPMLLVKNTEYPKLIEGNVVLKEEQFFFCRRFVKNKNRKFVLRDVDRLLDNDMLLKTLRADIYDFSLQFILGITPTPDGTRRLHNLRPTARKPFVVTTEGAIESRRNKKPTYTPEEKAGFSQPQSSTLIHRDATSPTFGFTKGRNFKLYGLMTDLRDAKVNRALLHDSGTVSRIFDHDTYQSAQKSWSYEKYRPDQRKLFYSKNEMDDFKEANRKQIQDSDYTNEVLARLKFNPYRSVVSICSDSLEARLLAYDFAQELMAHFASYSETKGETLNPEFQLPIVFYLKKYPHSLTVSKIKFWHEIKLYTDEMREQDQAQALAIYSDIDRRKEKYKSNDYEFLLGLPAVTLDILLEPVDCNRSKSPIVPLALSIIRQGYVRMLMRLLRLGSSLQPNLRDEVVEFILNKKLIEKNDPAITELILAEQFDMAETFIAETKSLIEELPGDVRFGYKTLVDHLHAKGNPRQIEYTGLHQSWLKNSVHNWVPIMLFIKEHPNMPRRFLGELLYRACEMHEHNAAKFLLENGAPTNLSSANENSDTPISIAAMDNDWEMVALFAHYKTDPDDSSEYGYALFAALREGKVELVRSLLQAGAKATWRSNTHRSLECRYSSTLSIAMNQGFDQLLPQLIEYEKTSSYSYAVFCCEQALKLANDKGNQNAEELIQQSIGPINKSTIAQDNSINQEVLGGFIAGGRSLANKILLTHCRQNQLLPNDNDLTAYAREWLMTLLQRRFHVTSSESLIQLLTIILPYFDPTRLKNRCAEVFIELRLERIRVLEEENFTSPENYAVITNVLVGRAVIDSIVDKIPPNLRAVLKPEIKIDSSATMTPIGMAAQAKCWELVQQICNYPTDLEDKCEYGFAVLEAVNEGLTRLATMLLQAGAKPTWRNHPSHAGDLRSALCIAIDLGLNELLPQLIEHEKKSTDEYFLMRMENALEHAHDKNNHEAIRIIQEKEGPIILIDADKIIPSICQRVFVALKVEGETIAKERLLKYLQAYHLLPNDNDLMASVNTWKDGLLQSYISSYLGYKDDFYDALTLLLPSLTPSEIREQCLSGLLDWILIEPVQSVIIVKLTNLTNPDTLREIGAHVIDSLLTTIPYDKRRMLIHKNENEQRRIGITPISRAAMLLNWKIVRQFTEIPTDAEDKAEYGFALCAALRFGEDELAELLIRAGAKTSWRNNIGHKIEDKLKSTLWNAIQGGLNKLLPQLIDFEKNYPDAYTMLGFEYALELAHEKRNQDAVSLIQENAGPIALIDPTQIALSICRRVLISLTIEEQSQAEKQLLNYGRQYHLLPKESDRTTHARLWMAELFQHRLLGKNACVVVEGLKIITPHVCAVLLTFPSDNIRKAALKKMVQWILLQNEPTLFGLMTEISRLSDENTRKTFAQIVINTILKTQPYNIAFTRNIIALNFSKGFVQEIWRMTFDSRCDKIRTRKQWNDKTDDEALLLFELNPMMPDDLLSKIFDSAIHRHQLNLARTIATKPNLSSKTKSEILMFAVKAYNHYKAGSLIPLMMTHSYTVTIEHLQHANHSHDEENFLLMLDHIDRIEYSQPKYHWFYLQFFMPRYPSNFMREKKLIALLGPSMVRHLLLIHWLMEYKNQMGCSNLSRFYSNNELGKYHYANSLLHNYNDNHKTDDMILTALNTYFSDDNISPKKNILIPTYHTIMSHIEIWAERKDSISISFFKKILPGLGKNQNHNHNNNGNSLFDYLLKRNENAKNLYLYMHELDQLLSISEEKLVSSEVIGGTYRSPTTRLFPFL